MQPKQQNSFPPSVHAYCSSGAVNLAFTESKAKHPTITVEFAAKKGGSVPDWSKKLVFQLTQDELAELCAFLFFPWKSIKWIHKSPSGITKALELSLQSQKVIFAIKAADRTITVPVVPKDQYFFRNLALSRLTEIQPPLHPDLQLASLRQLAESHRSCKR